MPDVYQVGERRPLKTRDKAGAKWLARALSVRGVSPNAISVAGGVAGILGGIALALALHVDFSLRRVIYLAAAGFIQLRLLANLLDGMVAVESGNASPLGEVFNEVPDRISDAATLIGAGYAAGFASLGYIAACVALFIAYIRAIGKIATGRQDFAGPMAKPHRMFVVTLACLFGAFAPAGWQRPLGEWNFMAIALAAIIIGGLFTALRRLARMAQSQGGRVLSEATVDRLFGWRNAFRDPTTLCLTSIALGALAVAPVVIRLLQGRGKLSDKLRVDLWQRYRSWLVLTPMMIVPVLLGAFWTILAIGVLSIFCYREFARATGLFRERHVSFVVVLGIVAITFAVLDNWYALFVSIVPITVGTIAAVAVFKDQPKGYIQRVALGVLAFMLCGSAFAHLGYFANEPRYRPILFCIVMSVELNDIFAYVSGKSFGRRKLAPHTSPNKTIGGAVGAIVLTTTFTALLGHFVFRHSVIDRWYHLIVLGMIVSVLGQLGDLLISSIKRDLEIKDMGTLLPGHGGLLDRFDSLILVAPAVFHYVGYYMGVGLDQQTRIFSGG